MNLFDLPLEDLNKVREVCTCMLAIARKRIPNRRITDMDVDLISTKDFNLILMNNSLALKRSVLKPTENKWSARFAFVVNYGDMTDDRPYSTRLNTDKGRYLIRHSSSNSILLCTDRNIFYNSPTGSEEYLDVLLENDDFTQMEGEIFQKSLMYSKEYMNIIMLNYLLRKDVPYMYKEPHITFHGFESELDLVYKAYDHIEEISKLC